jgi:glycosyltransferase involved in cell wall biosynthesis
MDGTAACDVVVHASVLAEPFGRVVVEAMLASRPVVATRTGGVPEVVTDGETGLLVPPGDVQALRHALERLLADSGLRERLGRAGRMRIREHFSWERAVAETVLAYENALFTKLG